jgi:hypothetical protein
MSLLLLVFYWIFAFIFECAIQFIFVIDTNVAKIKSTIVSFWQIDFQGHVVRFGQNHDLMVLDKTQEAVDRRDQELENLLVFLRYVYGLQWPKVQNQVERAEWLDHSGRLIANKLVAKKLQAV